MANGHFNYQPENYQATILKNHGRKHVKCIFLKFYSDSEAPPRIRNWVAEFAAKNITRASKQINDAELIRNGKVVDGGMVVCLFLSASGYDKLGLDDKPDDEAFLSGMKSWRTLKKLSDSPLFHKWEGKYKNTVDAMVLLADGSGKDNEDDEKALARLNDTLKNLREELKMRAVGRIMFFEDGKIFRNNDGNISEPFGYADGLSQLSLLNLVGGEGNRRYDPVSDNIDNLVLHEGGSYLVFRKLEQNVAAFRAMAGHLSRVGANKIGRFEDGTPLTRETQRHGNPDQPLLDFNDDPVGDQCPLNAHVRKTNPRIEADDPEIGLFRTNNNRIVRRGIPYGTDILKDDSHPATGTGLLFLCFQKSIVGQFEVIQSDWCNKIDFPVRGTGVDALIGQPSTAEDQLVTLKGGEYFHAPSMEFMIGLAGLMA